MTSGSAPSFQRQSIPRTSHLLPSTSIGTNLQLGWLSRKWWPLTFIISVPQPSVYFWRKMHRCSLTPFDVFIQILVYTVASVFSIATPDCVSSQTELSSLRWGSSIYCHSLSRGSHLFSHPSSSTYNLHRLLYFGVFAQVLAFATGIPPGDR